MANKGTIAQQETLSYISHPLMLKFLFAPIIDTYYSHYIGRSKTYIFILGVIAGISVLLFAPRAGRAVEHQEIGLLAGFWFFVNLVANFQQVAFESWTVTIVDQAYRRMMPIMLVLGFSTGYFTSYNAFVFFNSEKALNSSLSWLCRFKKAKKKNSACFEKPLLTHAGFVRLMGVIVLMVSFYVLVVIDQRENSRARTSG